MTSDSLTEQITRDGPPSASPASPVAAGSPNTSHFPSDGNDSRASIERLSLGLEVLAFRWFWDKLGGPPLRVRLQSGFELTAPLESSRGTIVIRDRRTLHRLYLQPSLAFGEAFSRGDLQIEGDLVDVLVALNQQMAAARPGSWLSSLLQWRIRNRKSHSIADSRRSVHHHYDIGNDFYRLWLDEQLLYTCAYYARPELSLEQAQIAKMDHICRKLQLQPGQSVVEAGCGWGALALHMARHYGVTVQAYNLSHEQILYARQRASDEGLAARVEFIEDDYRTARGPCDIFVSVGMLEHVGLENFQALGRVIDRVLKKTGRGLIHSIGRNRARPLDPWIDRYIFPGAYPPSLREMQAVFEPWTMSILDVENLRLHYAKTLVDWLARYEQAADEVLRMFDAQFVRTWRMYLAGSAAAFLGGDLQLFQVVFTRHDNNDIPWTRTHLYET